MTDPLKRHELNRSDVEHAWERHLTECAGESWHLRNVNRDAIRQFLASVTAPEDAGRLVIDQAAVQRWIICYAKGKTVRYVAQRFAILDRFFKVLAQAGLIDADPLAAYRNGHDRRSWPRLVQAAQSADPERALTSLRIAPPSGPLAAVVLPYIELQRSLGKKYIGPLHILNDFDRFLQRQGVPSLPAIMPSHVDEWTKLMTCIAAVRIRRFHCVRRFFDYLFVRQLVLNNPVSASIFRKNRWVPTSVKPFIFTQEQLAAILAEAKRLPDTRQFPCRAQTCSTMLTLLCALGLRHGEACRLRIRDFDDSRQALFIHQTKFHKSRYVPFGPKVGQCLRQFLETRRTRLLPLRDDDPFFVTSWRRPISHMTLLTIFRNLLRTVGIQGMPGRQPPRLHDIRHTFAVNRLLRWYRESVDVQSRLPTLATFMGHVRAQSTEVYLSATSDLLCEANHRFHLHFGKAYDTETNP